MRQSASRLFRSGAFILLLMVFASAPNQIAAEQAKIHVPAAHGFSPLHALKYGPEFRQFDYVSREAPKGGTIRIGRHGTFNSLNLLKYPGQTPLGRRGLPVNFAHYFYDSLLAQSADEVAAFYGLIAKTVQVDPAYRWVRFKINENAKWHDGKPITADDVMFTVDTMKAQGLPFYRQVLRSVTVKSKAPNEVTFYAARPGNREFVKTIGLMPIHPKHYWKSSDVSKTTLTPPLGSGPYSIEAAAVGRSLTLKRSKNYWAKDHPVNIGRYNFDEIKLEFYRSNTALMQGFLAGDFDIRLEDDAVSWAKNYDGDKFRNGVIQKRTVQSSGPGKMVNLIFNLRRPVFQDIRVRTALASLFDFEQTNFTLFHKLYEPGGGRYGPTSHGASGAATGGELTLLKNHAKDLPEGLFKAPAPAWRLAPTVSRSAVLEASQLLDEAGYAVIDGKRIDPKTGAPLILDVAYANPRYQRVLTLYEKNLEKLGVKLHYPILEPSTAGKKILGHDYDLTFSSSAPSLSAGAAEYLVWSSIRPGRDRPYALSGVADPVLDAAIMAMNKARSLQDIQNATRAFDRILRWRVYDIPLWRSNKTWLAYWDKFSWPATGAAAAQSFVDLGWAKDIVEKHSKSKNSSADIKPL